MQITTSEKYLEKSLELLKSFAQECVDIHDVICGRMLMEPLLKTCDLALNLEESDFSFMV